MIGYRFLQIHEGHLSSSVDPSTLQFPFAVHEASTLVLSRAYQYPVAHPYCSGLAVYVVATWRLNCGIAPVITGAVPQSTATVNNILNNCITLQLQRKLTWKNDIKVFRRKCHEPMETCSLWFWVTETAAHDGKWKINEGRNWFLR